jgi:hypothetical protein
MSDITTSRRPLPGHVFKSTQIPVRLWFVAENKSADGKNGFSACLGLGN